jgi:hypothetical protein
MIFSLQVMLKLDELAHFLQTAPWPRIPERRPTFFSIAGFPHYENVMSNVYQFFFDTDNPHGLGSLFIDALSDVLTTKIARTPWSEHAFQRAFARRELRTDNEKRLDILLHNSSVEDDWQNASTVILIENKVYHWLANDLGEYWQFVEKQNSSCQKIGIVLGLKIENIPATWRDNWVPVTHLELAHAIEKRLGQLIYCAEPRYVTLLLELIENIKTMTAQKEGFSELSRFYMSNRAEVMRVVAARHELLELIPKEVGRLLPEEYRMGYNKEATEDFWFQVDTQFNQPIHYIIWYGKMFSSDYENVAPSYVIELVSDEITALRLRDSLKTYAVTAGMIISERPRYILSREYSISHYDAHLLPQLIADNLRHDWQPLEKYWLNQPIP